MTTDPSSSFLYTNSSSTEPSAESTEVAIPAPHNRAYERAANKSAAMDERRPDASEPTPAPDKQLAASRTAPASEIKPPLRPPRPGNRNPIGTQAVPTIDFITTYGQYADVLEAPRTMHEVVGMQLIATVLNKNGVIIQVGGLQVPLDFWVCLLSGSGFGRSTLVGLAQPVLKTADLETIEYSGFGGSGPAVYQQFAEQPSGLHVWGEISEIFKLLNDRQFLGVKQWITDRYDNFKLPRSVEYRRTNKKNDTPAITFDAAPRINILATSSEAWFFSNLVQEDSAGGFVPRWTLVRVDCERRDVPVPALPDHELLHPLAHHLRCASELTGVADLSEILPAYRSWYTEAKTRFSSQANSPLALAYFNRHRIHILKLAVIYEASSSLSLKVSMQSWERAVEFARTLEETIFSLLDTGMSSTGYNIKQMEEKVKAAGVEGIRLSDFTRAFQNDPKARKEGLNTLVIEERIHAFKRTTGGRRGFILVHSTVVDAYRAAHSEDEPVEITYGNSSSGN